MYENTVSLNRLRLGTKAVVIAIKTKGLMRRRLQDLGIIEGTVIECVLVSPAGDPRAYLIRGAVVALRGEDSSEILIEAF